LLPVDRKLLFSNRPLQISARGDMGAQKVVPKILKLGISSPKFCIFVQKFFDRRIICQQAKIFGCAIALASCHDATVWQRVCDHVCPFTCLCCKFVWSSSAELLRKLWIRFWWEVLEGWGVPSPRRKWLWCLYSVLWLLRSSQNFSAVLDIIIACVICSSLLMIYKINCTDFCIKVQQELQTRVSQTDWITVCQFIATELHSVFITYFCLNFVQLSCPVFYIFTVRAVAMDSIVFVFWVFSREPLHSAWWNFARTCTLTTARNPENFKVIGHRTVFSDSLPMQHRAKKFVGTITHEPLHLAWS